MQKFEENSAEGSSSKIDEIYPKSRKVPLGAGYLPPHFSLTDYLYYLYDCRLPKELKRTLMYFASRFNWTEREATFVSLSRAANDLDIGRKYLSKDLKDLEKLNWVSIKWKKETQTYAVSVQIGNEDKEVKWKEESSKAKQLAEQNRHKGKA